MPGLMRSRNTGTDGMPEPWNSYCCWVAKLLGLFPSLAACACGRFLPSGSLLFVSCFPLGCLPLFSKLSSGRYLIFLIWHLKIEGQLNVMTSRYVFGVFGGEISKVGMSESKHLRFF